MERNELRDDIIVEVAALAPSEVGIATVNQVVEQILRFVDVYAGAERQRTLLWAADECRREARWHMETRTRPKTPNCSAPATAIKLEGVFKTAAGLDAEYNKRPVANDVQRDEPGG